MSKYGSSERSFNRYSDTTKTADNRSHKSSDNRRSADGYTQSSSRRSSADSYIESREHRPSTRRYESSNERFSGSTSHESFKPRKSFDNDDRYESSAPRKNSYESSERRRSSEDGSSSSDRRTSSNRYTSSGPRRSSGSSSSFGRSRSGGGFGRNRQGARPVKKFNPSDFIKKVEEQVVAPAYVPKNSFADFAFADQLKRNITKRGYVTPTPIQDQAIPFLLEQKDLIGTANTGTGKTATFLLPLVSNMLAHKTRRALVITPTRELAAQIQSELDCFKEGTGLHSVLCIGGLSINFQINRLSRNPAFVIGTPGRLKDLEQGGDLDLRSFDAVVLDEVDTMLDMGFINDIKYLVAKLPTERHTLFFSATLSREIRDVADSFLRNPVSVSVKTRQSSENINQDVVKVTAENKLETLHDLLIKPGFTKVIIFARTKRATDKLAKQLNHRGFEVASIHGDKTQGQRKRALDQFKRNQVKILLATDVVARGIDIDDVSHVINFDLPQTHEDYIHRIGRTGRANKIGQAITFIE